MKKMVPLALGFTPLLFGLFIDWYIMTDLTIPIPFSLFEILTLGLWFWYARRFCGGAQHPRQALILLNLPALLMLILVLLQLLVSHLFWDNFFGVVGQLFFLPLISLSGRILLLTGTRTLSTLPCFCISFLLLIGVSILGYGTKKKPMPEV